MKVKAALEEPALLQAHVDRFRPRRQESEARLDPLQHPAIHLSLTAGFLQVPEPEIDVEVGPLFERPLPAEPRTAPGEDHP